VRNVKGMTKNEIYSWFERAKAETRFPEVRNFLEKEIQLYTDTCPGCGLRIYESCRILYIREYCRYDFVTYICSNCFTGFRKIEFKDEEEV
jgi:hypothetical protein